MASSVTIRRQYERWPYPQVSLLPRVRPTDLWQLHVEWLRDRCGQGPGRPHPRVWIAGCGTFQPYAFATANPGADILATDLSERSLRVARRRCRLHGAVGVRFQRIDLTDRDSWPAGTFDLIECYGVLMNLEDPEEVLRGLGERLAPGGVLRVMVYPHYSRQRIFQVQRVGKLLGLGTEDRRDPGRLRRVMRALPVVHPLRWAFLDYADSRTDAGIVDGFLHAGDRGFTAFQLLEMVARCGLRPACWFQREWGQPALAAKALGLEGRSQAFVLNYLDLWQELRSNLVVCLVRDEALEQEGELPRPVPRNLQVHPMFDPSHPELGVRHRLRLQAAGLWGMSLPSKVSELVRLSAAEVRLLRGGKAALACADPKVVARLAAAGLVLGDRPFENRQPPWSPFPGEAAFLAPRLEVSRRAANPLYAHLFRAWTAHRRCPQLKLPSLEEQMGRWIAHADPLERGRIPFGLTPYRTYQRFRINVNEYLEQFEERQTISSWEELRLAREDEALVQLEGFLVRRGDVVRRSMSRGEQRELWCLLLSVGLFVGSGT